LLEDFGFYRPALKLHSKTHLVTPAIFHRALSSYLKDRSEAYRGSVFEYIHAAVRLVLEAGGLGAGEADDGGALSPAPRLSRSADIDEYCTILLNHVEELAAVSVADTKACAVTYLSAFIGELIDKTKRQPSLQFELLDAIIAGDGDKSKDAAASAANSASAVAVSAAADAVSIADSLSPAEMLCYLTSLATFRPGAVYAFITSRENYPLDEAVSVCRAKNIFDATSYLLERAGDAAGAIDLVLIEFSEVLTQIINQVESLVCESLESHRLGEALAADDIMHVLTRNGSARLDLVAARLDVHKKYTHVVQCLTNICARCNPLTHLSVCLSVCLFV
jgi:hypothetical protein